MSDPVNQPDHYVKGRKYEPIEVIDKTGVLSITSTSVPPSNTLHAAVEKLRGRIP